MEEIRERRKLERFDLEIPAKIEVISESKERETLDLLTSNICAGGAFFQTTQTLPEGTQVKIDMILPLKHLKKLTDDYKQAYIVVTGRVLRTESSGMAVSFSKDYEIRPWKESRMNPAIRGQS